MDIKEHKKEVAKLQKIEKELAKLISETENFALMEKFTVFTEQRIICNKGFADWVDKILCSEKTEV